MQRRKIRVSEYVAIGQLVIAVLMLWSLWQSQQNLAFTRQQLESSKRPQLIESSYSETGLHLRNVGGTAVEALSLVGLIGANLEPHQEVGQTSASGLSAASLPLCERLRPGEDAQIEFDKLTLKFPAPPNPDTNQGFAAIVRYYRAADRRPFYKTLCFYRTNAGTANSPRFLYFSMHIIPGSAVGGREIEKIAALRQHLEDLASKFFEIRVDE